MTRTPNTRFVSDIRLAVEISGRDEGDAEARLNAVIDFLTDRTDRTTFQRLAGQPRVTVMDIISDVTLA